MTTTHDNRDPRERMMDLTPTKRGYERMLLTIMEHSTLPEDRVWASEEIERVQQGLVGPFSEE